MRLVRKRENMSPAEKEQKDLRGPKRGPLRIRRRVRAGATQRMALVDLEIFAYQCCMEAMQEERMTADEWTWTMNAEQATQSLERRIEECRAEVGATHVLLAAGADGYWRHRVCETYKANRLGKKKPLGYGAVIEKMQEAYGPIHRLEWLEADDVLGLAHTNPNKPMETVVISTDKDMRTLPGLLYNPQKPNPAVEEISLHQADCEHMVLALAGDTADGFKGAQGVGDKTARHVLAQVPISAGVRGLWEATLALFIKMGHNEEYALQQVRLARVLRHGEYDRSMMGWDKVRLWKPPATSGRKAKR